MTYGKDKKEEEKNKKKVITYIIHLRLGQISSCLLMIQKLDFYYPPHDFYR